MCHLCGLILKKDPAIVYNHDDDHSLFKHFVDALGKKWNIEDEGKLTNLLDIEF